MDDFTKPGVTKIPHSEYMKLLTGISAERWAAEDVRHPLDLGQVETDDAYYDLMYNRQYAALVIAMNANHLADDSLLFTTWLQPTGKNWTPDMLRVVATKCNALAWEIEVWSGSQNPFRGGRPKTWEEFLNLAEIELAMYVSETV